MKENDKQCEVHGTPLERRELPISYGYPAYDPASEVKRDLFPNAKSFLLGGCVIEFDSPKVAETWVCNECIKAEEEWRNADPESRSRW